MTAKLHPDTTEPAQSPAEQLEKASNQQQAKVKGAAGMGEALRYYWSLLFQGNSKDCSKLSWPFVRKWFGTVCRNLVGIAFEHVDRICFEILDLQFLDDNFWLYKKDNNYEKLAAVLVSEKET